MLNTKKITNFMLAAVVTLSSFGLTSIQEVNAASLNSHENTILKKIAGNSYNRITKKSVSYNYKMSGKSDVSAYQWTAWYNKHTKDFTIDKSQTSGTYKNGFPKKTSSASTSTNFNKVGYFKYLRDPIYRNITLTANATYRWTTKDKKTKKETVKGTNRAEGCKENSARFLSQEDGIKLYTLVINKDNKKLVKVSGKSAKAIAQLIKKNYKEVPIGEDTAVQVRYQGVSDFSFSVGDTKTTIKMRATPYGKSSDGGVKYYNITIDWTCKTNRSYYVYTDHSKTIEVAKTQVASNVSATELSKFKPFKLQWKGGGTGVKNTAVGKKANAGWWRNYTPPYHSGSRTTKDTGGGYHYYTFSTSGTEGTSYNLRNQITKKEEVFNARGVPPPPSNYYYNLIIDPNGGVYKGKTSPTTLREKVYANVVITSPYREGYRFIGWTPSGSGQWNSSSSTYKFIGNGKLVARWDRIDDDISPRPPGCNPNEDCTSGPNGNKYTLRIDANGGTWEGKRGISTRTQKQGTTLQIVNPVRSGYTFIGWNANTTNYNHDKHTYTFNSPGGLVAVWDKDSGPGPTPPDPGGKVQRRTLTIDPNGGNFQGIKKPTTFENDKGNIKSLQIPTKSGYTFAGWQVISGKELLSGTNSQPSAWSFIENGRIKATWIKNGTQQESLTINPNGGTYDGSTSKKVVNATTGDRYYVKDPVREGYQFIGWDINTNNGQNGRFENNIFTFIKGPSTLTARWKKYTPESCIINGTGPNACPEEERVIPKFIHLTKNPGEWDD